MPKLNELTERLYLAWEADNRGVCLHCGDWSGGTDPGVAEARCSNCGTDSLHGIEQALLLGAVHIRRDRVLSSTCSQPSYDHEVG